jgi:hypothetical protein
LAACVAHTAAYGASRLKRACAVQGCRDTGRAGPKGIRLCRLHSTREEKPRKPNPKAQGQATAEKVDGQELTHKVQQRNQELEEQVKKLTAAAEASSSPGGARRFEACPEPWREPEVQTAGDDQAEQREGSALFAEYLGFVLAGWTDEEAMSGLVLEDRGWYETPGVLKSAAREYLGKMPAHYPSLARQAMLRLRNAEAVNEFEEWDPVMALIGTEPTAAAPEVGDEEMISEYDMRVRARAATMKPAPPPNALLQKRAWGKPAASSSPGASPMQRPCSSTAASSSPGGEVWQSPEGSPPGYCTLPAPATASRSFDTAPIPDPRLDPKFGTLVSGSKRLEPMIKGSKQKCAAIV